jgi:hypothetical protein
MRSIISQTHKELVSVLGLVLGAMAYSALLTLGIICIAIFHNLDLHAKIRLTRTKLFLRAYIILLLLLNTFVQIWNIRAFVRSMILSQNNVMLCFNCDWSLIVIILIEVLTDGLLVSDLEVLSLSFTQCVYFLNYRCGDVTW